MYSVEELKKLANTLRYDTLKAIYTVRSGHPGGCLSAAEIMAVLYFHTLRIAPENPKWEDRDRFFLSKGHAAPILFAALAHRGYFDIRELLHLRLHDGMLQATPNPKIPGCESVSGSLGQNLSIAIGCSIAGKMDGRDYKTYCLLGDGEMEEGQVWEALMLAPKCRLGNLVAILDNNHVQMCGTTDEIVGLGDVCAKFRSFGWNVVSVDGHNVRALIETFDAIPNHPDGIPTVVVADTVKGKGVSFMEGKAAWHGGAPSDEQWAQIERELGGGTS